MKKNLKVVIRIGIVSLACAALVVGYFLYLNRKNSKPVEEETVTEAQVIITTDFDANYPETPRAVVKWYNRIATCIYNRDCEEDEVEDLALQERKLLDDELLKANPEKEFMKNINEEIKTNEDRQRSIVNSEVCESNDIVFKTVYGYDCAYVTAYYFGKEGSNFTRTYQKFCLRKDKDNRWKILTFEKVPENETSFKQ